MQVLENSREKKTCVSGKSSGWDTNDVMIINQYWHSVVDSSIIDTVPSGLPFPLALLCTRLSSTADDLFHGDWRGFGLFLAKFWGGHGFPAHIISLIRWEAAFRTIFSYIPNLKVHCETHSEWLRQKCNNFPSISLLAVFHLLFHSDTSSFLRTFQSYGTLHLFYLKFHNFVSSVCLPKFSTKCKLFGKVNCSISQ